MARRKTTAKVPVSDETNIQLKIISAQGMTDESAALECAVNLLYQLLPSDKNARVDIQEITQHVLDRMTEQITQETATE